MHPVVRRRSSYSAHTGHTGHAFRGAKYAQYMLRTSLHDGITRSVGTCRSPGDRSRRTLTVGWKDRHLSHLIGFPPVDERHAMESHTGPRDGAPSGFGASAQRARISQAQALPAHPNRFATNRLGLWTTSGHWEAAGVAVHVLSLRLMTNARGPRPALVNWVWCPRTRYGVPGTPGRRPTSANASLGSAGRMPGPSACSNGRFTSNQLSHGFFRGGDQREQKREFSCPERAVSRSL